LIRKEIAQRKALSVWRRRKTWHTTRSHWFTSH